MLSRYSSSCGINLVLGLPWVSGIHDPKWVLVRTIVHDVNIFPIIMQMLSQSSNWDEHKRVPHLQVCEKFY